MAKTTTRLKARKLFASIKGRHEDPRRPNVIFVWAQLIRWKLAEAWVQGQPYCAGGVVWTLRKLRLPIPDVVNPWYCPSRVQWYRAKGRFKPIHEGRFGDEVFFAFSASAIASGLAEHVGRLTKDVEPGDTDIHTFEFNTSSGTAGSQDNGGGCYPRRRPIDATVLGVGKYGSHFDRTYPEPKTKHKGNPYGKALRGYSGRPIRLGDNGVPVAAIQWAVGVPVDGKFGPITDHAVRYFQRYHVARNGKQLVTDGEVGRLTREAILKVKHPVHSGEHTQS